VLGRNAAAVTVLLVAGCGSGDSSTTYPDAASVAKAAGLASCKPDPQEVGVTDAMACAGTTEVDWFKSHAALNTILVLVDSSPDTFLVGDHWAIECVHRQVCVTAKAKIGGELQ
jgi:hypothetical protein